MAAAAVHAAPISWSPVANTGGKADLVEGNVVIALNGGTGSPVVNGGGAGGTTDYTFAAVNYAGLGPHSFLATTGGPTPQNRTADNVYSPGSITSTGDPGFDTMVASVTDTSGTSTGITAGVLTLNGLADGDNYTIQVFFNDQRDGTDNRTMTYGDGEGNTVDVIGGDPTAGVQPGMYGQFALGTFTASGTSQDLTMLATGFGNVHFNAIVVTGPPGANIPPEFDETFYVFEVADGAALDTVVGTVQATDPDGGPAPVEYAITFGNDGNTFAIDPATGEITVVGAIDINSQFTYTLEVTASDGADATPVTVWVDVVPPPPDSVTVAFATSVLDEPDWVTSGFGDVGYIFPNTDDDDLEAGSFKRGGAVYNETEAPGAGQTIMFSQLALSNVVWSQHGLVPGNALTAALNVDLENPDGGTFKVGNLQTHGLGTDEFIDSFSLTFDEAAPDGYRIGILVGAKESQGQEGDVGGTTGNLRDIPYQIRMDTASTTTTQTALDGTPEWMTIAPTDTNTGLPRADWYFFDLTDITAGSFVTISATRIYSAYSHKFNPVNGVVISSLGSGVPDPLITGVSLAGNILTIDFTGEPGVTDWKVMAGTDLQSFPIDETPGSIPEGPTGVYQAQVDVTGDPASYFMRIER